MKKWLVAVFAALLLSACGGVDEKQQSDDEKAKANEEVTTGDAQGEKKEEVKDKKLEEQTVEVDKGLLNVEVTLPASMFEGEDIDTIIKDAKENGVKEATKNEDGSLTYKMSKATHKEMMKEIEIGIIETIEEMKTSQDYVSIKDIAYNKSFSEFTLVVDKAKYENSMDGFASFGLGISGMYYQLFNGDDSDNYKVAISIKDEASGEVFDEIVYPDDLEGLGTN